MTDTIAAIATAVGTSAVNIIKISGPSAISIVNKIFTKDLTKLSSNTINYGYIKNNGETIDEVLVSIFRNPNSSTGEDVIEINSHGGIAVTNKILEILLTNGCRLAEPGEYLKRAFLNGKKDLLEAESISDLINAKTESFRKMSTKGLTGELSALVKRLREKLLNIIANIEVNIDYPEYEDAIVYTNELLEKNIIEIKEELQKIVNESEKGSLIKNGINVGIIGKPNVGKSSLLNKLINEDKAIVTDIEGTTRDIVEGTFVLNGVNINLIDTAGIRETDNIVEKIGVEKSKNIIEKSNMVIALFDGSREFDKEDKEILKEIKGKKAIILINKVDLPQKLDKSEIKDFETIEISVKDNKGINLLIEKIKELFNLNEIETGDFTYLSNARQISIIKEALALSEEIKSQNEKHTPVDLIQIDIQKLWEKLGELTGDTYKDELLDEIFSKFCLGK
ncbi:MAG: tRNA uridine-5-carboxymethylaminomethyl(34) synthesis GTPase MnmE [Tenericutes bacterium]|nr:tRNA uridine-5-carboxymethylaminomethyl(34) synthesis GTPase MnmE [Mycoplasmatota bacterium]